MTRCVDLQIAVCRVDSVGASGPLLPRRARGRRKQSAQAFVSQAHTCHAQITTDLCGSSCSWGVIVVLPVGIQWAVATGLSESGKCACLVAAVGRRRAVSVLLGMARAGKLAAASAVLPRCAWSRHGTTASHGRGSGGARATSDDRPSQPLDALPGLPCSVAIVGNALFAHARQPIGG